MWRRLSACLFEENSIFAGLLLLCLAGLHLADLRGFSSVLGDLR